MIDYLKDAKRGDEIWFYDSQRNRYAADGKTYEGRGVWRLETITGITKRSIDLMYEKYDNKTGLARAKNGFSSGNRIAGQKQIAALVGYQEQ